MAEFDSVIPAGGSGKLTAKIKTKPTQTGSVSKSIGVNTDSPTAQRVTLSVTFKLVNPVAILPRPQLYLNGIQGDVPTTSLIFHRADGEKLEITGIEGLNEKVSVVTKTVTEETAVGKLKALPGDVIVEASVAPGTGAVIFNQRLTFETNHPDAATIDVPLSVRLRPLIEARPNQLRLVLQDGNAPSRNTILRVQHNLRRDFKITGITPSSPEIFRVRMVDGDVKQKVHTIAVMLLDEIVPGSLDSRLNESLVVKTNDPKQPELVIPVVIESRQLRRPGKPKPAG